MPARVLTLTNQKGGVGKSFIARMVAHYLASIGCRVLCLDADHQRHLTNPLVKSQKCVVSATGASKAFTDPECDVEDAPFVLMPGDKLELEGLERQPERYNDFARNMRRFFVRVKDRFDFIVIDTNPNPDIRVVASLVSSDFVLAPIVLSQESLDGLADLFNHPRVGIARVQQSYNPRLRFLGMLPSQVDEFKPFQAHCLRQLMGAPAYRERLIPLVDDPQSGADFARIRNSDVVKKVQSTGQVLSEIKGDKTARGFWKELEPVMKRIAQLMGANDVSTAA